MCRLVFLFQWGCVRFGKGRVSVHIQLFKTSARHDSVWRDGLWHRMRQYGVEEKFVRVCKGLNNGVEARIVTEGGQLRWFWIERGLRQGCPSLPTLFNLYVSGMVDEFKRARMGVKIDDEWCGTLLYVNDIVL